MMRYGSILHWYEILTLSASLCLSLVGYLSKKVGLVKSLAGDYDADAVRGKLDNMVADNPVLMLSFTTWPYCIKGKAFAYIFCNVMTRIATCSLSPPPTYTILYNRSTLWCCKAKQLLDEKGAKYTAVELDKEEDGKAIRAVMGDMLGRTSVPAIWIKGTFIGGW